jgi:uncharacterized protein YcbK (DUF882 family)
MVNVFKKGISVPLSAHFSSGLFDCHCTRPGCTTTSVDIGLCDALESLRLSIGPFKITSGFRCKEHNAEIGGVPDSQHRVGKAADCVSKVGKTSDELAAAAELVPQFAEGGIGRYSSFTHVDVRGHKARWTGRLEMQPPC